VAAERGLPFAMMIGSKMRVNPALGDAGDMVGKSDVQAVVRLCAGFPQNKFFCTMLAREKSARNLRGRRKFGNLMLFGCWWFLNNPSLIEEMTRMRIELLGTSMIPQHSDSRVLDQLVYKWTTVGRSSARCWWTSTPTRSPPLGLERRRRQSRRGTHAQGEFPRIPETLIEVQTRVPCSAREENVKSKERTKGR